MSLSFALSESNNWTSERIVVYDPNTHSSLQDAIDEAEGLSASSPSDPQGCAVFVPPGLYGNALIKKNVSLIGHSNRFCKIGTLTFRPDSDTSSTRSSVISGLTTSTVNVLNETYDTSDVFDPDMGGITFTQCSFDGVVTLDAVQNIDFYNCNTYNDINKNNCEGVNFYHSKIGFITSNHDDSASRKPTTLFQGNLNFEFTYITGPCSVNKTGGTEDHYLVAINSNFEDLTVTGNIQYRLHNSMCYSFNSSGSNICLHELPSKGLGVLPIFDNTSRPNAANVQVGQSIFNTDAALQVSNGTNWIDC